MGRWRTDDPHIFPAVPRGDGDLLGQQQVWPHAAHIDQPDKTAVLDLLDQEAHLVQMSKDSHAGAAILALLAADDAAQVVVVDGVRRILQILGHHPAGPFLMAADAVGLGKAPEHLHIQAAIGLQRQRFFIQFTHEQSHPFVSLCGPAADSCNWRQ